MYSNTIEQQSADLNRTGVGRTVSRAINAVRTEEHLWIWLALAVLVALWALSIATWGIPGLYIPAVVAVPVIMFTLLLITRG
ncbi:hypothetical protein Ga0609869_000285 [Rhodovulum iodosum]|uniref:Fatty acid desaturase n=1 Tax=Rhodovulum iodosum TaxID=68291 RepID=A0ABV3XNQ2_9RHOB|nr:hypothetical protein [Rhodovulum robiginosum]RSK34828.1 hypothetical protein EJA01_07705 [Rhodovulum robiginosum]